jgi:hypothetical protein
MADADLMASAVRGGFSPDTNGYVIPREGAVRPPLPWANVVSNPSFGFIVTDSGAGYTWSENSRENRLTSWSNDPVLDPSSEALYLRRSESGDYWSLTPSPAGDGLEYKVCHEFGHGLACRRFGGECHEIGVMFLVFTPCLYCNVSDSWRMPNKWHRAVIGAAGMYVELILAIFATFIWWFAEPGIVRDICLQVMLIASVSTVLFNGNPLLRFDGYYILSDLLEIPNLHQRSAKALSSLLGRYWMGLPPSPDPLLPQNRMWAFAAFTVLAFIYRIFIMVSIFMFLNSWLKPYGLEAVGQAVAVAFAERVFHDRRHHRDE